MHRRMAEVPSLPKLVFGKFSSTGLVYYLLYCQVNTLCICISLAAWTLSLGRIFIAADNSKKLFDFGS